MSAISEPSRTTAYASHMKCVQALRQIPLVKCKT